MTGPVASPLVDRLFAVERPFLVPFLRVVLCLWLAAFRMPGEARAFLGAAAKPAGLLHAPVVEALGFPWPLPGWAPLLPTILVALSVLAAFGVLTRVSLGALFVAWLYVGGVRSGWGFFNHTPALAAQVVLALAILPGTTAWSVDRLVLWLARRRLPGAAPTTLREALAPPCLVFGERLLLLAVGLVYFASGVAKLRHGGLSWLDGTTLAWYLEGTQTQLWFGPAGAPADLRWKDGFGIEGYTYLSGSVFDVGAVLARLPGVPLLLSWATLVLELGAPVFLWSSPRRRGIFCLAVIGFHTAVVVLVGPGFDLWMVILGCFIPWPAVVEHLRRRRRARAHPPGA